MTDSERREHETKDPNNIVADLIHQRNLAFNEALEAKKKLKLVIEMLEKIRTVEGRLIKTEWQLFLDIAREARKIK